MNIYPCIIKIIKIISLIICKYTLPKKFINNNFNAFLCILASISAILTTHIFYQYLIVLSLKIKHSSFKEEEMSLSALRQLDTINKITSNSTILNYILIFVYIFSIYILRFLILGRIMRYFFQNIENNYKIFSIALVIF